MNVLLWIVVVAGVITLLLAALGYILASGADEPLTWNNAKWLGIIFVSLIAIQAVFYVLWRGLASLMGWGA